ncbi:rhodanese-like domain-containing protein [Sulfurimonas microaerophilic]|uniref:rhodanese-like domain-containing protein n=1 Tax=Sulfurimonas microaerophilic TaxID=3058392 RepID=UPI0027148C52|nr:rhodanese-like domain-containing protein [Sulfurimonas sp. hsl 1-7]
MNRLITLLAVASLSVSAMAFDNTQAKQLDRFYSNMTQEALAKSKLTVSADAVMKMLREKKDFILLDVRTEAETSVVSLVTNNTVKIPLENLFNEKNLNKLPTDKPIVIVCHSGARELLAASGLQQIGFKNIQIVKGGIAALAVANSVKNAPVK